VYRIGESIVVTIENDSPGPIQFMEVCSPHLCQKSGEDWICEEKECDSSVTVLESGSQLGLYMEATSLVLAKHLADTSLRYKLDYQIVSEDPLHFAHSNEFTVIDEGPDCGQARQIALDHALSSPHSDEIDAGRATVNWQADDQTCVVDFAWQGAEQIRPGLWTEGYYVVVAAKSGRVKETHAYER
jgi:hypothetical protein